MHVLAVLQRKTLIETKNRTLKCLKWHYLTVRSMKNVAVLTGIFPLFSSPPRGIWQLKSPHPRELAIQGKQNALSGGSLGSGGLGVGGIDWCIKLVWSDEKIDLIKHINYENTSHSHVLPPDFQSFQFPFLYHKAGSPIPKK